MKDRLKELRKVLNLTQQEFSDRIGVKRNTIATYESGRNDPIDAVVSLICREFHVNKAWLRTGEGEMFAPSDDSALDALADEYGLDSSDRILIRKYASLRKKERAAVLDFMQSVVAELNDDAEETGYAALDGSDIEKEVESYRSELEQEASQVGESSASPDTAGEKRMA